MIYAISDLHGCYEKYRHMLEKLAFREEDRLYVLGDVIDRGAGGIDILLDMMQRENVVPLKGNHEAMALEAMKQMLLSPDCAADVHRTTAYRRWMYNDGAPTASQFCGLDRETQKAVVDYMSSFLTRAETEGANGRRFHLSHTLPTFCPELSLEDASCLDFLFGEPDYEIAYAEDVLFVTGHTPTHLIDPACKGRIYQKNNHIAIDCGAAFGNPLGCICLDTLEPFYAE